MIAASSNFPADLDNFFLLLGGEEEFNYHVHILPSRRVVYFSTPKAFCSSVIGSMHIASIYELTGEVVNYQNVSLDIIHNRKLCRTLCPYDIGYSEFLDCLEDTRCIKFGTVREPLERLVSCFQNKVFWKDHSGQKIANYFGLEESVYGDVELKELISFEQFVYALFEDPQFRNLDAHWREQVRQLMWGFIPDMRPVGETGLRPFLENLFTSVLGKDKLFFDARTLGDGYVTRAKDQVQHIPADSPVRAQVYEAYAADYLAFGSLF